MIVTRTRADLAGARRQASGRVAAVMTMGALHAGHRALIDAARKRADTVIVTIFVNPLQFGPNEDFGRYPRTLEFDLGVCEEAGVDLVFAPDRAELYPDGEPAVRVDPGPLGERLEGASRPGFFHGVLTVVLKLLQLTRPDEAYFGEKDYQQLTLIRRMVLDLDVPVEIVGVPTVREPDGLALSSRNRYLSPVEREAAQALSRALNTGTLHGARSTLDGNRAVKVDYLVLATGDLEPVPDGYRGPGRLLVAAWVGPTRLIDNVAVEVA